MSPAFVTIYAPVLAAGLALLIAWAVALYLIKSRLHSRNLRLVHDRQCNRGGLELCAKRFDILVQRGMKQ